MDQVLEGEYKGKVTLIIRRAEDDKFPFQFGLRKAKMVLDHVEDIRRFVERHRGDPV